MLKLLGYPSEYSVAPGEKLDFMVSAEENQRYEASLVRVICGDCNPEGPGLQYETISSNIDGTYEGKRQKIDAGSYMTANVGALSAQNSFSFFSMIWPTLPNRKHQVIFQSGDLSFEIHHGHLTVAIKEELYALDCDILVRQWYSVGFSIDLKSKALIIFQKPLGDYLGMNDEGEANFSFQNDPKLSDNISIAGREKAEGFDDHYDGKIDGPLLIKGMEPQSTHSELRLRPIAPSYRRNLIALWDFSQSMSTVHVEDISLNANHGVLHQAPTRAMKGCNWSGEFHKWPERPDQYGAVHFHHDDLYDANWDVAFTLEIPNNMRSAAYAVRVKCGENTRDETRDYYIPFFVRAPRREKGVEGRRDKIAFLAPTASYIAYANHGEHITAREAERTIGRLLEFGHADLYMYEHPELGGSLYDSHLDGSGVCLSSRKRPVLNFTSQYHSWLGGHGSAVWQYNADLHLLAWMEAKGFDFEIITDEDLHKEGVEALNDYRVVLTGTHPEYYSTSMWNGLKDWIDAGGRFMYLGANGFYWHVAFSEDQPGLMEVRRAEDGIRTWMAEPGEYYHSFTGEMSGLFRRRGHAPNEICGLGFIAQGFDICSYYRRAPDADNPRAAFIFEGIDDEIIGDFGLIGNGAAGLELDCITTKLGTPPHALRLATSENHSQQVQLVNEEFGVVPMNLGGDQNDRVRADLVFYETSAGGAVFGTGSISWCGSLPTNDFDNNVSRLTENVLRRFADPEKFHL